MSHKRSSARIPSQVKTRESLPGINHTKDGTLLMCPFCQPSHPLVPNEPNACGTQLKVTAVQTIIPERAARSLKITCLKCHKLEGGDFVQYMNGFIHLTDCTPGTQLLRTAPQYNRMAGLVYKLPKSVRAQVSKLTGFPQQVREIDTDGKETGKIIGYFFLRGNANATRQTSEPSTG